MALRFSGDTEIRVQWDARTREYHGSVRDPYLRFSGRVPYGSRFGRAILPTSPEAYDAAALALLTQAQRWARSQVRGGFRTGEMLRRYQAPCPVGRS